MDNNQMRAMYNSFGTLNRPQSFGDDLYNDKENLMPASPELTQTGTDEAGNPIMAPVNMPEAPQNDNPILDNVIEYASNAGPAAGMPGPVGTIMDMTMPFVTGNEEQRQQVVDRIRSYATPQGWERGIKSVIHSMSNATELEHTKLYENYFYNAEKKNEEVKRIANILHIDGNTFAHNRELYQKAALAADRVERLGKFKKYQDAEGNIDMAKIYADTPGLAEVQQKYGTAAAALALGNIDGIRSINEVYDNAFSRFAGSVYAGARRGWIADRRAAIWNDARKENRLPTTEEQARLDEYAAELNALPKYNYNTAANVAGAMIGGAMENMAMILKSQGAGAVAGLAAGRLGGVKAGEIARNAASTYIMAQQIAGNQYEELVNKTDAQGRPMYTQEQASWLALAQGYGEAVLEQYSLNQIGKAIFGRSAAKSLTEIIKSSPTLEAAKAGVRDYAALKLREAGKAGFISLGAEAFEEFTQSASDMLMENMAQIMLKGKDADTASIDEILTASTGQMLEALPAIGGFGLIGFGINPIANTRAVLGFRSNVRNVVNNNILLGRMANAHYNEVLTGVWKNKGSIKELENKAPETVTTILDVQNRAAGMEEGFVDIKNLSQQENGMEMVRQIAEQNNISDDELRACMDGSGMLQVKTSTLMQMDLKDEQHKKLLDNITTSLDAFTSAQETNAIKIAKEQMDSLQKFNDKTYKAAVDNIIAARFPDEQQARLAREIIEANYDNPQEEFKRRLDAVNAEMDEYIGPVLQELKSGMKQGVDIIRIEGGKDGRDDTYRKQSNNADWYRNYFADYGRAPNAEELLGLAIDIASGRQDNRYGLMDYQNNTDETRACFAPVAETLDRLEEERNALLAIQDRMRNLNPGEMVATAVLSKDALRVYDNLIAMMGESENKNVRKAGKLNALLMARYADNMAKVISRIRQQPYTAADFARDRFKLDVNAIYDAAMQDAAQMFQVSPAEFARQKEEVRKQYEGTDSWMVAPDGSETNLTEDQWITVRTPAFKNWFGDWENDPANASKVLDENGEPLVVYHGTVAGEFDTFDRSYGSIESDMGNGFYFTNNSRDVKNNYEGGGPDFENKVARLAERIESEEEIDYEEAEARARAELFTASNLFNVFLNIRYPAYVESTTILQDEAEAEEVRQEDYEDEDAFYEAQNEALENAWSDMIASIVDRVEYDELMDDTSALSNLLRESIYNGGIEIAALKEQINNLYPEDAEGNLSGNEILRIVIDELGYDGIIDETVSEKFRGMDLSPDTTHYIAFKPAQIKDATGRNVGFDPKSGNIYYQQQGTAKGAISFTQDGQRFIRLFETADQSTFIHEMAHMFLLDLQEIAGIDTNSQQAKDLNTIMAWAEYKPGQVDEYKGTASAEEFRKRDAAIKEAEANGDTAKARQLKDAWAQERFARAFEEYLRTGEAPAQGLKRAFRQFKKWLVQIYNDVIGAGVRATPEVEAIMARMVASEDEIDAMDAANNIARLKELDPDFFTEDAVAMRDRWQAEAKEQAKEKLLKDLMKLYEQNNLKDIDKRLEEVREAAQAEFENVPCFVCEKLLADGTDMASALEITGFETEQDYKDALAAAGGSMAAALDNVVKQAKENMLTAMPGKAQLYSMAEEALLSGDYNTRLSELEAELMRAREKKYDNIPSRLRKAFTDMDAAITNFETEAVRSAVQKLKYAERWGAKEFETIKELESYLAKMESQEEAQDKLIEKFNQRYEELKQATVRNQQWIRGVRDATLGHARVLQSAAVFRLAEESVSVATNVRYWHRQALAEAKKAWDNIARAQRRGEETDYNASVQAKQQQAVFDAMTAQAIKNRETVDKWLNGKRDGFMARGKRMADPKVKANADMRYFHNHLLYIFGLRSGDATPPVNYKEFTALLSELRASHQFEDDVPAWLIAAAEQDEPGKNFQQLTMGELEELYKLTRILYRLAVNDKGLLTMDVDMDTVVAECVADWQNNVDYEVGNQRINEVKGAIGDYMNGLLKPEVLLSMLGGKQGAFVKYIYRVLFNAAEAEEKARETEAKAQKELYNRFYTKEELRSMVNDSVMVEGPDGKKVKLQIGADADITKENLICMALNWGNEANRARLTVGLFDCENETELAVRQAQLMDILRSTLTEKDWNFVQAMWDHINTFAEPVSEVMEKSVGVPLDRVKADAFDVELPDGKVIRLAGGYYPIVKDSSKSTRQSEFEQMEEAKALGGVSVFGTGMSATKARADSLYLNQGPLKLTLDVANNHITAQIHLINAKMAVRDAYKVINNKTIQGMIKQTCGGGTVKTMNDWVLNCWAPPIRPRSWYESIAASLRSKTVGAIMGYRVSTALLNAANVVYMAQEIGTKNALAAMVDFYRHPIENRREILDISVFMRNRASNMDRDLNAQNDQILKRHNAVGNAIDKATGGRSEDLRYQMEKYANWLIEQTDMMVSLPLYRWQFMETYNTELEKGVSEEEARETANYEATRRVTKVFGSSRAVDSSAVQRSKNEMVKLITPFFSFANTMMNAVWSKYYEGKYKGSERIEKLDANGNPVLNEDGLPEYTTVKKSFVQRYGRFVRAILFNFVLGAMVETLLREVPDLLGGTGDDDDDEKRLKNMGKNILGNAMAGFPGINEGVNFLYESFFEKPSYMGGRGVGVLSGTAKRYSKVITDLAKLTQGKDSIDALDLFRDVARAANTRTGISDTLTDAIFNTARFIGDDYRFDDMADLREYIAKTIFDRKLKKKK